jgi:hypothetical protein
MAVASRGDAERARLGKLGHYRISGRHDEKVSVCPHRSRQHWFLELLHLNLLHRLRALRASGAAPGAPQSEPLPRAGCCRLFPPG